MTAEGKRAELAGRLLAAGLLRDGELFDSTPEEVLDRRAGDPVPLIVAYGGGLNSSAGLVLFAATGDVPDAILFADTGGEKPQTYAHVELFSRWCEAVGFPPVTVVRRSVDHGRQKRADKYDTLESECLVKRCLPSIAYYHRSCSEKWKHQPQEKWANGWQPARERWTAGGRVVKAIFYDAGEAYRAKVAADEKYVYWHPLLSLNWGRAECVAALEAAGLPVPPKSSCFFCPEMTPAEIFVLPPDLLERALAMEGNANLTGIKGLGKHEYSWSELVAGRVPLETVGRRQSAPCGCHDDAAD
jgi:hypothetical protein